MLVKNEDNRGRGASCPQPHPRAGPRELNAGKTATRKTAISSSPTPQRQAFLSAVRSLENVNSPDALDVLVKALSVALPQAAQSSANSQTRDSVREAELEWKALQRAFEFRRALLRGAITTTQVGQLLGVSRQAVAERERKGQLLCVMEDGQLRFPLWQFDPSGSSGVVEGLPFVVRALDEVAPTPALGKMVWLRKANSSLGGLSPVEALRAGRLDEVMAAARGVVAG